MAESPKLTRRTSVKPPPWMSTCVPTPPRGGEKLSIHTAWGTVKAVEDEPAPASLVTDSGPVFVPVSTTATSSVSLRTSYVRAGVVPKPTSVVPVKPLPVTVTCVPAPPESGEKLATVGFVLVLTENVVRLAVVPPGVVTRMLPLTAPGGTVVVSRVPPWRVMGASAVEWVPKRTLVAPVRFVPDSVTCAPALPDVGDTCVTVGAATQVKDCGELRVSTVLVTLRVPLLALLGT